MKGDVENAIFHLFVDTQTACQHADDFKNDIRQHPAVDNVEDHTLRLGSELRTYGHSFGEPQSSQFFGHKNSGQKGSDNSSHRMDAEHVEGVIVS